MKRFRVITSKIADVSALVLLYHTTTNHRV